MDESKYFPFYVFNDSSNAMELGTISQTGTADSLFYISRDECSNKILAPDAKCKFYIYFNPKTPGIFTDSFNIFSDDYNESSVTTVNVSGTGKNFSTPLPVTLVHPSNEQTGLPETVEFIWKKTTDPDGDSVRYTLYYCHNPDLSLCSSTSIASTNSYKNLFYGSITGNWIILLTCMLFGGLLKGRKGIKITPFIAILIIGGSLLLISCNGGGSSGGDDPQAGSLPAQTPSISPQPTPGDDELSYTGLNLKRTTTYYWKVAATDSNGDISESETRSFSTL